MKTSTRYMYRPILHSLRTFRRSGIGFLDIIGEISQLLVQSVWGVLTFSYDFWETLDQMSIIGVNSLPIVLLTIMFSGMVLALYTAQQLVVWGLGNFVGGMVAVTIAREMAPVLASIIVAARAGSAIAAEIGSMKVTEQIDALRSMAVSPVEHLVIPRFVALVVMLPFVTMLANVTGTAGGYLVAAGAGVSGGSYITSIQRWLNPYDVTTGLMKTMAFGAIIALVSCRQGLKTEGGAAGVGRATTGAVVLSIVLIYFTDFFLVRFLFAGS